MIAGVTLDTWAQGVGTFAVLAGIAGGSALIFIRKRDVGLISTMRIELDLADRKIDDQQAQIKTNAIELDHLRQIVKHLEDLVTQAAKVDLLRDELRQGIEDIRLDIDKAFARRGAA
jgi:hypothetical protein